MTDRTRAQASLMGVTARIERRQVLGGLIREYSAGIIPELTPKSA